MQIVIAGGTGFLGRALARQLESRGDRVVVLTRTARAAGQVAWNPTEQAGAWVDAVASADVVVNLAGEPVDAGRWTPERKRALIDSRVGTTAALVERLAQRGSSAALINASAIGFYGAHADEPLDESAGPGDDFLARLCVEWEATARRAEASRRVVLLRTGLVLDRHDGALPRMALPFQLFAGGPLGSGRQYWSWIHRDDWVGLVVRAIDADTVRGPLNLSAPTPVTNREFARTLGRVLHRPGFMPAPAVALRLALGEMADAMILNGQRVLPAQALRAGYAFRWPQLEPALRDLYRD